MKPKIMQCDSCDCEIKANFQALQFENLNEDEMHFVRLFLHCEGRIREMERALGVSYPTVKSQLAGINAKLSADSGESSADVSSTIKEEPVEPESTSEILAALKNGEIDVKTAIQSIKDINN